jgi:hypothetical protein
MDTKRYLYICSLTLSSKKNIFFEILVEQIVAPASLVCSQTERGNYTDSGALSTHISRFIGFFNVF